VREASDELDAGLKELQASLVAAADKHRDVVLPGYTHMQRAQPITVGAEMNAWHAMFTRDRHLINNLCASNLTDCPLGSGALAGSVLPLDREMTASALGFSSPSASSIDSTASRDEALDLLYTLARTSMHLSRLAGSSTQPRSLGFLRWTRGSPRVRA